MATVRLASFNDAEAMLNHPSVNGRTTPSPEITKSAAFSVSPTIDSGPPLMIVSNGCTFPSIAYVILNV